MKIDIDKQQFDATTQDILQFVGPRGTSLNLKWKEGTHTVAGGGLTENLSGALPAGSLVLAFGIRITTTIVMATGVNFDIGISGAATRYGENITTLTAGTSTGFPESLAASSPVYYPTATNVLLTANAGTFTSGALRYVVCYLDFTELTS